MDITGSRTKWHYRIIINNGRFQEYENNKKEQNNMFYYMISYFLYPIVYYTISYLLYPLIYYMISYVLYPLVSMENI